MSRHLYGRAFVGGAIRERTLITIDGDRIIDVVEGVSQPASSESTAGLIVPGFIDVHIHGGDGADFMDGSDEATARVTSFHAAQGTTALAATTLSASPARLESAVASIARVSRHRESRGAAICGIHLEGPFINAERAGAQDRASIRPASISETATLLTLAPHLRWIMTIAPEVDGAHPLIEHFKDRILFSIGHTAADYGEAVAALDWGAAHFTHLFNAMTGMHHREPGAVGAAFIAKDATVELIADGIHVHPAMLRLTTLALPGRVSLITDAVRACGMPEGIYKLYDQVFTVSDGAARLTDGTLAGSVLTMARAVQNMVELAGLPIEVVLPLATETPARILGAGARKGKLAAGFDADIVILNDKLGIERVLVRGRDVV